MKKYLKVEFGSRGSLEVVGFVETDYNKLVEEMELFIENCEDEDDKEYYEEFMYVNEYDNGNWIAVGLSEDECCDYIKYEGNEVDVDRIVELIGKVKEGVVEERDVNDEINDILSKLTA